MMNEERDMINEVPGSSPEFRTELAEQLAELAPEAIADGKIDVEKLKELLEGDASNTSERFGLFWPGKKRAMRAAQTPTTATLRPDKENSKDWDTTKNVFIEGDNLEVLKILQKHYHGKIKMIYIDPPYNTGKDFVYPDNYKEGLETYLEWSKQVNEDGKKLSSNSESEGRYHSNWLNLMYPRLKLARNLLSRDGAIFASIDDSEFENLKRILVEVFGEDNFVGSFVWSGGRKNDSKFISTSHEYILCFARNLNYLKAREINWKTRKAGLDQIYQFAEHAVAKNNGDYEAASKELKAWYKRLSLNDPSKRSKHYNKIDENGVYFADNISWPGGGGPDYTVEHPVTKMPVKTPSRGWLFQKDVMEQKIAEGRVEFGADENKVPTFKRYLHETEYEAPYSVLYQDGRSATKRVKSLFGNKKVFDFPKDENILAGLIDLLNDDSMVVLDFFAGSSSTAHAVMQSNAKQGARRKFIMVQLPEPTPEKSVAKQSGYSTVSEISRARIRYAGEKIVKDITPQSESHGTPLDIGFRSYKLADTNFTKWRTDSDTDATALAQHLLDLRESADDNATPDDLFTEILIKQGHSLVEQIRDRDIDGLSYKAVVRVDDEDGDEDTLVLAYLDEHTKPTLAQLREAMEIKPAQFIMLEDAFQGDDELKTNLAQICKTNGIELWTA
ncbi:site-specific DNA-methyltransferase [Corynebacterium macginleyi]|uniref:site-specific DNA-methyltransferase n=1 Tax=Corynebacterium macginleyi TaxID=38290 RepID=UPI001F29AC83|nr:site-specific DNA-methyltransferase [Corynebacterium macginleyi]